FMGMVDAGQISARPDFVRPALSDRERLRSVVWLAGIFDRHYAHPRSEYVQGCVFQNAGARSGKAGISWSRSRRRGETDGRFPVLGRRGVVGYTREQPQLHVR